MATARNAQVMRSRTSGNRFSTALRGATGWLGKARKFRQTRSELSALTDAELNKLGLSRDMIRPLAWQAAKAA
ncbi:DUF1127 domain-containing protein [Aliiruegeria lutimaris]|uniref:YjiS-like domain-containing protein n=1 Tax=Aliiruegeria lutimaris TaxID=571298 RepID=A0A1G8XW00_9RHOB|nr:DUF1127 domain-containing protein [Aliiruegeria lutimaris]SDJ93950.1 protein of unknown function [Aliiruegeria lutimaris]